MNTDRHGRRLWLFQPFIAGEAGLPQEAGEKARTNVAFVFVENDESDFTSAHLGMLASGIRALES